ncbi:unnamed protein product [Prorocentrum cordatum]|uniref:Uncharacterized protein n=1 Tax=Prorocentrum cordatum TaxID=2364126 RepID=A0ABN9TEI4_9DINO|nr:unnamed protein product [Polarella glacialis]
MDLATARLTHGSLVHVCAPPMPTSSIEWLSSCSLLVPGRAGKLELSPAASCSMLPPTSSSSPSSSSSSSSSSVSWPVFCCSGMVLRLDDKAGRLSEKIELGVVGRRVPFGLSGPGSQEDERKRKEWDVSDKLVDEESCRLLALNGDADL